MKTPNVNMDGMDLISVCVPVAVQQFGQTCELPGSFESDLHGVLTYSSLVEAVRGTIMAGGDNCSRAAVLAAFFAAQVIHHCQRRQPLLSHCCLTSCPRLSH